jgi:hypothetical protein
MADETDADVLARLRRDPDCPAAVLLLAEQAARKGLLAEANERAEADNWTDAMGSSQSGVTTSPAGGPDSDFQSTNWSRTYYSRLRAILEKVLGLPLSVQPFGED